MANLGSDSYFNKWEVPLISFAKLVKVAPEQHAKMFFYHWIRLQARPSHWRSHMDVLQQVSHQWLVLSPRRQT